MNALSIRAAVPADIADIHAIYSHHVLSGTASFEVEAPTFDEMRVRYESILAAGYPYLVAVDVSGHVVGYAYASAYRARYAYRFAVENSIYVRGDEIGRGIGHALMSALIAQCAARGYRQMIAVIGDSGNAASIALHARCGFRMAGVLPSVGYKFDRWIDSVLMTRPIGDGDASAPRSLA